MAFKNSIFDRLWRQNFNSIISQENCLRRIEDRDWKLKIQSSAQNHVMLDKVICAHLQKFWRSHVLHKLQIQSQSLQLK
jgi:hypothetical protein